MFNSRRIEALEDEVRILKRIIKQELLCPHNKIGFRTATENISRGEGTNCTKTCEKCNKILECYPNEEKMNQARIEYYEEEVKKFKEQ